SGTNTVTAAATRDNTIYVTANSSNSITGSSPTDDTLSYALAPGAVTFNLASATVTHSFGGTDSFSGILNLSGSAYNDTLVDGGQSIYYTVNGGGGTNTLDETHVSALVSITLTEGGIGGHDDAFNGATHITTVFDNFQQIDGGSGGL